MFSECFADPENPQCGAGVAGISSALAPLLEEFKISLASAGKKVLKNLAKTQVGSGRKKCPKKQHGKGMTSRKKTAKQRGRGKVVQKGKGVKKRKRVKKQKKNTNF